MNHQTVLHNQTPKLGDGGSLPPRRLSLDLPQGLNAALALSPEAAGSFARLPDADQGRIAAYIQSTDTGEEALARVRQAARGLERGELGFLAAYGGES